MGTGGKKPSPKTQPVYIVASKSNSGFNLSFEDGDVFLDLSKAENWCKQKNAAYKASSNSKEDYYFISNFDAIV